MEPGYYYFYARIGKKRIVLQWCSVDKPALICIGCKVNMRIKEKEGGLASTGCYQVVVLLPLFCITVMYGIIGISNVFAKMRLIDSCC